MELQPIRLNSDVGQGVKATFKNALADEKDDVIEERFLNLLKWLGIPPCYTTLRINTCQHENTEILEKLKMVLEKQCADRGMETFEMFLHPALRDCVVIKNRGPKHNLKLLNKEVIVDLACGMAVLRGADVFAQGIMAAPTSMHEGDMVSVYSDLNGECRKGLTQKFTGQKMFVGNGVAHIGRTELFCSSQTARGIGIKMTHPLFEAPSVDKLLPDLVFAQNLPSIVCSHVLDPQPGEVILDMCAAPGGKTVHIATLMKNKGRVVALDKTPQKISKVAANTEAWGVTIVEMYAFDSRNSLDQQSGVAGAPPYPPASFNRILLDAPCSALGQRPVSRNRMKLSELKSYSAYQRQLFHKAVELLKPGGVLVFSTCTVTHEENEGQVAWALKTFPQLSLAQQTHHIGGAGLPLAGLGGDDLKKVQRFDPSLLSEDSLTYDTDTIGFFIAKFKKSTS